MVWSWWGLCWVSWIALNNTAGTCAGRNLQCHAVASCFSIASPPYLVLRWYLVRSGVPFLSPVLPVYLSLYSFVCDFFSRIVCASSQDVFCV